MASRYKLDAARFGDLTLYQLSCLLEPDDDGEDGFEVKSQAELSRLLEMAYD